MKYLTLLLSVLLFAICDTRADDTPPPAPAATAPATPPAPAQNPATPAPVAAKPDEDTEPGAFKRRLQAAAAVITGNHADPDAIAARDKEIADLKAENAKLTARVAAQDRELVEAVAYVKGLTAGTADPTKPPSATAKAAAQEVQNGIAAAARAVGIPTTALTNPPAAAQPPAAPAAIPAFGTPEWSALSDSYWKARPAATVAAN